MDLFPGTQECIHHAWAHWSTARVWAHQNVISGQWLLWRDEAITLIVYGIHPFSIPLSLFRVTGELEPFPPNFWGKGGLHLELVASQLQYHFSRWCRCWQPSARALQGLCFFVEFCLSSQVKHNLSFVFSYCVLLSFVWTHCGMFSAF